MAVIINEFEVVVEPPARPPAGEEKRTAVPPAELRPEDVRDVLERAARVAARVRAH